MAPAVQLGVKVMPRINAASNRNMRLTRAASSTGAARCGPVVCSRAPCRPARLTPLLIAALVAVSGCGGGESQDANETEGTYRLEVADASFPAKQSIAEATDDAHPRAQPGASAPFRTSP